MLAGSADAITHDVHQQVLARARVIGERGAQVNVQRVAEFPALRDAAVEYLRLVSTFVRSERSRERADARRGGWTS